MSPQIYDQHVALKRFLNRHLYSHEQKLEMTRRAQRIIEDLFAAYSADPARLPADFGDRAASLGEGERARLIADYIAGMTDRYAIKAHEALTG
jgi:dGTPase